MAYEMTVWQDGDLITAERMNKLEQGVANNQIGPPGRDGKDGAPGKDGQTPRIGENGNWWIGEQDTGIPATGPKGDKGDSASGVTIGEVNAAIQAAVLDSWEGSY